MKNLLSILYAVFSTITVNSQPSTDYRLVFFDDFNSSTINPNVWNKSDCTIPEGDDHISLYMAENVYTEPAAFPSCLVLRAEEESPQCNSNFNYTSAIVNSVTYLYGYFEFRAWVPGGEGGNPALWFWSPSNNTQYSELDVLEMCSEDCERYKCGFWWDPDNDGIADYPTNNSEQYNLLDNGGWNYNGVNDLCSGYKTYGVEWTPTDLKWFHNGNLVQQTANLETHQPLNIIISFVIHDLFGCNDTDLEDEEFPRYFLIDWVKVFMKENSAITIKSESTEICVGDITNVYVPIYDGAVYSWNILPSNSLEIVEETEWVGILASDMPGFQGNWRRLRIRGLSPGNNQLTLTVSFPSGYIETKSINIQVVGNVPSPQTWIGYEIVEEPICCYNFYTNFNSNATSYSWSITKLEPGGLTYNFKTISNRLSYCFDPGDYAVGVKANNVCGSSTSYGQSFELPELNCEGGPPRIQVNPNPTTGQISISLIDANTNQLINNIGGNLYVLDNFGNTKLNTSLEVNPMSLELSFLNSNSYRIVYEYGSILLHTQFIIDHGN